MATSTTKAKTPEEPQEPQDPQDPETPDIPEDPDEARAAFQRGDIRWRDYCDVANR